nr:hypothetical transcript [Hymenolepis microstoma]
MPYPFFLIPYALKVFAKLLKRPDLVSRFLSDFASVIFPPIELLKSTDTHQDPATILMRYTDAFRLLSALYWNIRKVIAFGSLKASGTFPISSEMSKTRYPR